MHLSTLLLTALTAASTTHAATNYQVKVGATGLTYEPNNLSAEVGSFVEFSFFPKNHTVSQSTFSAPCQPLNTTLPQIHSGFLPTAAPGPNNLTYTIKITDPKPIWLYCGQTVGNHCQQGMVLAINAPASGPNTFAAYQALARAASIPSRVAAGGVQGGVLAAAGEGTKGNYTSTSVTVTSQVESTYTSTYADASTTYTTAVPTVRVSTIVVFTTFPVQTPTGVPTTSPTASLIPGNAAGKGVVVRGGLVGGVALGAAIVAGLL